jgi:glycosyltransferase involved in cell wall biosynthesis
MKKITIIICTYNRCQSLADTLYSIAASSVPDSLQWEVVVVDNNSCDQTREVVEEFCRKHAGRFRYLFEAQQGLSRARNTGVREAQGEIVVFTDDDVTVEPMWLQNLAAPLHNGEWAGAGGRTFLAETIPLPTWLPPDGRYAFGPLVIFDGGPHSCELHVPPYGVNMAFQKIIFEKYGGFRTDLGHCAGGMVGNEDTEFGRRLLVGGERLRYEPLAVVHHRVTEHRIQKKYFLAWWFAKGRADIRELGACSDTRWMLAKSSLQLAPRLAVWILRWITALEPPRRFSYKLETWMIAGRIVESCCQWREAKRIRKMRAQVDVAAVSEQANVRS